MQITIPEFPRRSEALTYTALTAVGLDVVIAVLVGATGDQDPVATVLMLASAAGIYWFICRQLTTIVTARNAAAAGAVILVLCALVDFLTLHPYHGLLFLIAAAALGGVLVLLMQGTAPLELRVGGVLAVSASAKAVHLQMLGELHRAGILTTEELAAKTALVAA
jgi:hypothetical protein